MASRHRRGGERYLPEPIFENAREGRKLSLPTVEERAGRLASARVISRKEETSMSQVRRWSISVMAFAALVAMQAAPARAGTLERVPADRVCMVNDTRFPTAQIPVPVEGKTYFGCCEMCKGRLATDTVVRMAVDPVSGKPVDKATATIGALPSGKVLYFENEKNLNAYQAP